MSEYQQYQDALAEDEFFDEDQVAVLIFLLQTFIKENIDTALSVLILRFCDNFSLG